MGGGGGKIGAGARCVYVEAVSASPSSRAAHGELHTMMETYLEALLVDVDLQVQHVRGLAGLKVPAGIERRRRTGDVPGKQRPSAGKARHQTHLGGSHSKS